MNKLEPITCTNIPSCKIRDTNFITFTQIPQRLTLIPTQFILFIRILHKETQNLKAHLMGLGMTCSPKGWNHAFQFVITLGMYVLVTIMTYCEILISSLIKSWLLLIFALKFRINYKTFFSMWIRFLKDWETSVTLQVDRLSFFFFFFSFFALPKKKKKNQILKRFLRLCAHAVKFWDNIVCEYIIKVCQN